jgi:hypothetical protein
MSYGSPPSAKTQSGKILALLIKARGEWVPLPEVMVCGAQYNACIFDLRRLGFSIENKTEEIDGARHSWFRLVSSPTLETFRRTAPSAAIEPEWKHRPRMTGLLLFDAGVRQ